MCGIVKARYIQVPLFTLYDGMGFIVVVFIERNSSKRFAPCGKGYQNHDISQNECISQLVIYAAETANPHREVPSLPGMEGLSPQAAEYHRVDL